MGLFGYSISGLSTTGTSRMYDSLPYQGYRYINGPELDGWITEFIDAIGSQWDIVNELFIKTDAKANLLDATYTPTTAAGDDFATPTTYPVNSISQTDTMLDVLCFIACAIGPMDTNLSVAQKQALVQVGWKALRRKSTRRQIFNVISQITGGVVNGWTPAEYQLSVIVPDGAPSPGHKLFSAGGWVPASATPAASVRPWVMQGVRNVTQKIFPAWSSLGVGYSQFRAGYSAAGEPVFTTGCRLNRIANEHFGTWTAGVPDSWTQTGGATLTQSASGSINWEFSGYCAQLDLTAAGAGSFAALSQAVVIDNQVDHVVELDYDYYTSQRLDVLGVQIIDSNYSVTTATDYYWDAGEEEWTTTATTNYVAVSTASGVRTRASFTVTPQSASSATNYRGTTGFTVKIIATSDGTGSTNTTYNLYRVGVYEKFSTTVDAAATGERSLWLPLVDAPGNATWSGSLTASSYTVQVENGDRSIVRQLGSVPSFDHHPALGGRAYRSNRAWTNLLPGSNTFDTGSDYTLTTASAGAAISGHILGANANSFTSSAANARIQTTSSLGNPSSASYIGGAWVKRVTSGNYPITLALRSNVTVASQTFYSSSPGVNDGILGTGDGWDLLVVGPYTFGGGLASLRFDITWGDATAQNIGVASMFCYLVTGATDLKYPPVTQTPIHATATLGATTLKATTNITDTNVYDKYTLRQLVKASEGFLSLTVVPTYGSRSMPNGMTIFDFGEDATHNRLKLYLDNTAGAGGTPGLVAAMWDDSANTSTSTLTLVSDPSPSTEGYATWLRDTAIRILCRWNTSGVIALTAGNGTKTSNTPGSWSTSDTSITAIRIGCDIAAANQFDGFISNVEALQVGLAS